MESFDQCGDHPPSQGYCATSRSPLLLIDGGIARSRRSKREDRPSGRRTWRRDQNQVARAGGREQSELSADRFSGRAIERSRANDCFAARSKKSRDKLVRIDGLTEDDVRRRLL